MSAEVTPARRVAFEVLRRTFEDGAWTDRAFTAAAARAELGGRELAQARRLAYGAVQRRGDLRPPRRACSPAAAAGEIDARGARGAAARALRAALLRDGAEHAAVDQAVELAKGACDARAAPAPRPRRGGFVNAILRRAAREREELLAALDDSTPAGAAIAHSYPAVAGARCGGRSWAPSRRGWLMAAMNEPAETALRVNTLRAEPARARGRAARERGRGPRPGLRRACSTRPTALVVDRAAEPVGRAGRDRASWSPQSRGSQAVVALLDPQPGERVLDLCAGPGDQDDRDRRPDGESRRGRLDRARPAARGRDRGALRRARAPTCVGVTVADAAEADLGSGYDRILLDPPCSDLGTLASRPDARWRKSPGRPRAPRGAAAPAAGPRRRGRWRPGGTLVYSTCTISARENEERRRPSSASTPRGLEADDLGAEQPAARLAPRPALPADPARARPHHRLLHRAASSARRRG